MRFLVVGSDNGVACEGKNVILQSGSNISSVLQVAKLEVVKGHKKNRSRVVLYPELLTMSPTAHLRNRAIETQQSTRKLERLAGLSLSLISNHFASRQSNSSDRHLRVIRKLETSLGLFFPEVYIALLSILELCWYTL